MPGGFGAVESLARAVQVGDSARLAGGQGKLMAMTAKREADATVKRAINIRLRVKAGRVISSRMGCLRRYGQP